VGVHKTWFKGLGNSEWQKNFFGNLASPTTNVAKVGYTLWPTKQNGERLPTVPRPN
jgi:hypothetical protein